MADIETIKSEISETTASLEKKVHELESHVRENLSPTQQIKKHPWITLGLCIGAGLLTGAKLTSNRHKRDRSAGPRLAPELLKPVAVALIAGLAGEVIKERYPEGEAYVSAVQSAVLAKATVSVTSALQEII